MELRGINNERYITSRELGRGGEGTVYELQTHASLVLKKYNEPLDTSKVDKLRQMVAMKSPGIEAYAAWPSDLVLDDKGMVCGFVMRKLSGYVPLHMIFSPMDRKKMFLDKGYNFLVHVARNLATAFFKLHEAGLVVGDVNEGNILISASGLVTFIDCDSFQVKGQDSYFFCEVGVPRYTPPELLKAGTFDNIVRTVNTDSFSMAVLIFQLLFLGRHPFAGKNKTAADIDEETAIRQKLFAYSLENKKKKLAPPNDSFSITNLPEDVVSLFHLAFEQDSRPIPATWITALDKLLGSMVTCSESRLHTYPSAMQECPWCYFKRSRGILYFLDDSYIQATASLADIEGFVNGFKLEKLELQRWNGPTSFPDMHAVMDPKMFQYNRFRKYSWIPIVVSSILLGLIHPYMLYPTILPAVALYKRGPFTVKMKKALKEAKDHYELLKLRLDNMIREHDSPADLAAYNKGLAALQQHVQNFRRLPEEFERRRKLMEEKIYNEQLYYFLNCFRIEDYEIPSFGPQKKAALYSGGIYTAADIMKLPTTKIQGIGPKNQQVLLDWRRQMATGFVYIPDTGKMAADLVLVNHEVAKIKSQLEAAIRKEYHSLNYMKQNITNRSNILSRQINDLAPAVYQAELDYTELKVLLR